jgi:hypothetical protein
MRGPQFGPGTSSHKCETQHPAQTRPVSEASVSVQRLFCKCSADSVKAETYLPRSVRCTELQGLAPPVATCPSGWGVAGWGHTFDGLGVGARPHPSSEGNEGCNPHIE